MSESSYDSISNSMMMTCFCGEMTRYFTSRTSLNPGRRFYRFSKPKIPPLHHLYFFLPNEEAAAGVLASSFFLWHSALLCFSHQNLQACYPN
ncbi:hypothetical protein H5410_047390 [Solanum commersonii]|uniref:Uncharacterized protein n=1 Tax=Solanum commersonii TaxID=4109 RepID=A0A9J5XI58_SOLCO|nr:hypothetical protein H5410_047390 [Solanum commersonii]